VKKFGLKKIIIVLLPAIFLISAACAGNYFYQIHKYRQFHEHMLTLSPEEFEEFIDFPSGADITNLFYENRELFENIKDVLYASGFVPHSGWCEEESRFHSSLERSIRLEFNYRKGKLFINDDPDGEKLQSIQNVHKCATEWFRIVKRQFNPRMKFSELNYSISFREIRGTKGNRGTIIDFRLSNGSYFLHTGIMHKPDDDPLWTYKHLEDDWYLYWSSIW